MANYQRLKLTKKRYDELLKKGDKKAETIVFQFAYGLSTITDNTPGLRAYGMKKKHEEISKDAYVELEDEGTTEKTLPDIRIQGDLQVTVKAMEQLKMDSNPNNPENYDYFIFTPESYGKHIRYEISIKHSGQVGFLAKIKADPSPPATAD